jgi:adenylate cyclase
MADIFVSYARADRARVAPLVAALEAQGFSVWWDPEIVGGQEFDALIARELESAKAAIVVWTPASVSSRWVRGEARFAADRQVLTPIQIDAPSLPLDFRAIHTIDFDGWNDDCQSRPFQDLTRALGGLCRPTSAASALRPKPPAPRGASICVLPFANMSGDPEQEYFADGISEDIITDLSKVSSLFVIARNTAFTFKGRSLEVPQVARQLAVSHILEGSVRKVGNRVRINAQLIDGASGGHLWAERWDRDLNDIFALQDEICQAIVGALKLKLLPQEKEAIEDRGTASLEAYDKYLRARALAYNASKTDEMYRARDAFQQVLAIDPDFALARGALAQLYSYVENWDPTNLPQLRKERDALADDAMARAPDHWTSHLLDGARMTDRRDWFATLTALEKALTLAPSSEADARYFVGLNLGNVGRVKDWIRLLEIARAADPLSPVVSAHIQMAYHIDGRDPDSRAEYERTLDLPGLREMQEHTALFREWDLKNPDATRIRYRRYLDVQAIRMPVLAGCMEVLDRPEAARAILRDALEDPANFDASRMMIIGIEAGLHGDDGTIAVPAFRRALLEFDFYAKFVLWWPSLRRARQTPEFRQLVRDLGVYDYWRASGNWGDFARPVGDDDFEIIR